MAEKFKLPARYGAGEKSVWVEYIQLAAEYKPAVNLGQGFPDYHAPEHVTKALSEIATGDNALLNQYTRGFGHPPLVQSLSKLYSPLVGKNIDPFNEIIVTYGAYEALYSAILGTVTSADWVLDEKELEGLFNSRTKMIILNTPHNPIGKVFTKHELELIADLCKKHNVLCLSDEVYEWMAYEPAQHIRIASLPGMWERTITVGSAGKAFSVTGWKTGWAYGPAALMKNLQVVHQNCVYTCCTPIQVNNHHAWSLSIANKIDLSQEPDKYKDYKFTKKFAKETSVLTIPPSAFYSEPHKHLGENYVRFCFIKKDENLRLASKLIKEWNSKKGN
ncbi:hypothetical protein HF086_014552 [Spodoptera exigua]|uniref:Aminotransferase class I/classII large domain-containing protein n=1 Tax=Spodoptera exigua TaxID=7107 RepID=A0A922M4F3_SPOEX|nr:hypothetical protein HF086_014552 [Spodoptera exigua]